MTDYFLFLEDKNLSERKMLNFDEISYNSKFSTGYNIDGLVNISDNYKDAPACKEEEFDMSSFLLPEKKSFEREINFKRNLELNYFLKENKAEEPSLQNKKIKFLSKKEDLEKKAKKENDAIYRKDAYYKHFKALFAKYIRNKANRLKNICFPHFTKNNFSALAYKYTGNPKEKDNYNFLFFSIKELLIYGKNEKIKNRQYNNELLIKYIERNKINAKDKCLYVELINFLNDSVENELIKFYRNENEFEKVNKDVKCLFFEERFKRETGFSLLEKDGFIKIPGYP